MFGHIDKANLRQNYSSQARMTSVAIAMAFDSVSVALMSGRAVEVAATSETRLEHVKLQAEETLQVGRGVLLNHRGELLATDQTLAEASLKPGEILTLHVRPILVAATAGAFAARLGDGSVETWGSRTSGGDSSLAQGRLRNVRQICASDHAFAAILDDGSVVAWGEGSGADTTVVDEELRNVQQIQATRAAFAAIRGDGSVVAWGAPSVGGCSAGVQDELKNVQQISSTDYAFAAIRGDGSVVTWGQSDSGGDCSAVQDQLRDVQQIRATQRAFAAIRADGPVVTWGNPEGGGDSSAVQDEL